jgi:hypothetical protein
LYSCGANAAHGVPRTNEDKRRAVMKLLQDAEWSHWSDREIAKHAKVDHKTVARFREEIVPVRVTGDFPSERRTFKSKHGTVATMNTAAIGRSPSPPVSPNTDEPVFDRTAVGSSSPQHIAAPAAAPTPKSDAWSQHERDLDRTSFFRIDKAMSSLLFVASAGRFTGYDPG